MNYIWSEYSLWLFSYELYFGQSLLYYFVIEWLSITPEPIGFALKFGKNLWLFFCGVPKAILFRECQLYVIKSISKFDDSAHHVYCCQSFIAPSTLSLLIQSSSLWVQVASYNNQKWILSNCIKFHLESKFYAQRQTPTLIQKCVNVLSCSAVIIRFFILTLSDILTKTKVGVSCLHLCKNI